MSNLLNSKKKQLLNRGPKIEPKQSFSLDDIVETAEEVTEVETTDKEPVVEKQPAKKPGRPKVVNDEQVTSVRLMKSTRSKLNTLVQLGKGDSVDMLLDMLVEEYVESSLTKDEKRIYNVIYDTLKKR